MTDALKKRLRSEGDGVMSRREKSHIADLIEQLEAERDKYRKQVHLGFKHLIETPVLTDAEIEEGYTAFEHIRLALAKAIGQRDSLRDKLASAQAHEAELLANIERLREALEMAWSTEYIDGIAARKLADEALAATQEQRLAEIAPAYDENEFQEMVKRGTAAWSDVADASQWLEDMRGGNAERDELSAQKEGE